MNVIDELIQSRDAEYGSAWKLAGDILGTFHKSIYRSTLFTETTYGHNWVLILSKLIRALSSPYNRDHWQDIQGYAKLVTDDLTETSALTIEDYSTTLNFKA